LLCFTAGYESDLLIGAGCVQTIRSAYVGLESFGLAPMFTQFAQQGKIQIMEETEASLVMGIRAKLADVGFMPSKAWLGTDLPKLRPDVKTVIDPYTHDELIAFPAIACDVVIIHGLEADEYGNVKINNNRGIDMELVYLADKVIATVEKIVTKVEPSIESTIIPNPGIDYIIHAPYGAKPTSCYPNYPLSGGEFMRYTEACNAGEFDTYLQQILVQNE
jgi:glutaconate CoA-transferase subunit A